MRFFVLGLSLCFIGGCTDDPRVVINLSLDPALEAETTSVVVTVSGAAEGATLASVGDPYVYELENEPFARRFVLAPNDDDPSRQFEFRAEARLGSDLLVARVVRDRYTANTVLTIDVVLEAACRNIECVGDRTCVAGTCVDPGLTGGARDAGLPDAGASDAQTDVSACIPGDEICDGLDNDCDGVADNSACADGLFCNAEARRCDVCTDIVDVEDLPDADGIDANCDGIDGDIGRAIFVELGAAGTAGTRDDPVGTVTQALLLVNPGRDQILIAEGKYPETPTISVDVGLFGAYTNNFEQRDPTKRSTLETDATGLLIEDATRVSLQQIDLEADNAGITGRSSYAIRVFGSVRLTLQSCTLRPGKGAGGPPASARMAALGGNPGLPGTNGRVAAGPMVHVVTGAEPSGGGCREGLGGNGGSSGGFMPDSPPTAGTNVGPGTSGGIPGTNSSDCSSTATDGGGASSDDLPVSGAPGTEDGLTIGEVVDGFYVAPTSAEGLPGSAGGGGRGGGGGGSFSVTASEPNAFASGGSGGSGGNGGCGGRGGARGFGGGASIGVLSIDAQLFLTNVALETNDGGIGGPGGRGGQGGEGGGGGLGGLGGSLIMACQPGGGDGGIGGTGVPGGRGGSGRGGAGGASIGLYLTEGSTMELSAVTFGSGRGGNGGPNAPGGITGQTGASCEIAAPGDCTRP